MWGAENLKIGDKATIYGHTGHPISVVTIVALTDRKITDSRGGAWNRRDGHAWGSSRDKYYYCAHISEYKEGDEQKIWRRRSLQRISYDVREATWNRLTDDELALVICVLDRVDRRIEEEKKATKE